MNKFKFTFPVFIISLGLLFACASSKNAYHYHGSNIYDADLNTVLHATAKSIQNAWLDVGETKQLNDSTYELHTAKKNTGYYKGRSVIENSMVVIVQRINANQTRVTIKKPPKPMAVTNDNTPNYERKIFSGLALELRNKKSGNID